MATEVWQIEAKKIGGESLVQVIEEIRDGQHEMLNRLDQMDKRHTASEQAITAVKNAFPSGDIDGHRRYHQTMIDMLEEKRKLRVAIQEKTISGLVWIVLVGIGMSAWHELLRMIGR